MEQLKRCARCDVHCIYEARSFEINFYYSRTTVLGRYMSLSPPYTSCYRAVALTVAYDWPLHNMARFTITNSTTCEIAAPFSFMTKQPQHSIIAN